MYEYTATEKTILVDLLLFVNIIRWGDGHDDGFVIIKA